MFNEEITDKAGELAARVGQLTLDEVKKALEKLTADIKSGKYNPDNIIKTVTGNKTPTPKHGKMTLKELSKQGGGLSTVELTDPHLRRLHSAMKRHNIDFSVVKDGKGKYTLFFKGRDVDSMAHAFKEYTQKIVKQAHNKPSIGKTLAAAKEAAKALDAGRDKVKDRSKGALDR